MEVKTIEHVLHSCAGCGLCESICPTKAIQMIIDEEGFAQPMIDEERCIKCGQCFQRCILQSLKQERQPVEKVYAAFSLSEDIRYHSTSGGIFTEIAQLVLEEFGGVVIGAAYQKDFSVKHELISCVEDIPKLRQSKYIQSDLRDIYKEINKIAEDVTIMFSGTPCQVQAMHEYMKGRKNPVIYVDFICRGVNSPEVYQRYLKELEEKNNSKVSRVWFKNKENGWNHFQTRIDFENGNVYEQDRYHDPFMRGFLKHNLYMRKSCHECQFKGEDRIADITLADFWGIEFENKEVDVEDGVSAVLIHSDAGRKIYELLGKKIYAEEKELETVRRGNVCFDTVVEKGKRRKEFYNRLKAESFSKIIWSMEE